MKTAIVNNITEFLEVIHQTDNIENNWYRGQRFSAYQLEPSLFRDKQEVISGDEYIQFRSYQFKDEESALQHFKKKYSNLYNTKDFDDIYYLYLMQHHDIPTRLLDFSTNPLVALYFSVIAPNEVNTEKEDDYFTDQLGMYDMNKESSAVYCINPLEVNHYSRDTKQVIDLSEYNYSTLVNIDFPICIKPKDENLDVRLKAQKGVFVYFGREVHPLDYYSILERNMLKIVIPNSKRDSIKTALKEKFNLYHSTIFPDMKGIGMETMEILNSRYK